MLPANLTRPASRQSTPVFAHTRKVEEQQSHHKLSFCRIGVISLWGRVAPLFGTLVWKREVSTGANQHWYPDWGHLSQALRYRDRIRLCLKSA